MTTKEVYFDVYCKKCKHWEKSESEDPCYDCLEDGWNEDSHKPVRFEGRIGKDDKSNHCCPERL